MEKSLGMRDLKLGWEWGAGCGSGERWGCCKRLLLLISSWVIKALGEDKHKVTLNISCCACLVLVSSPPQYLFYVSFSFYNTF